MVFCSPEFFVFFLIVGAAYWALPSRWVRALLPLLSVAYLGYAGWHIGQTTAAAGWTAALAEQPLNGELFWVAAVVLFGSAFAWLRGPDRGRVWLLLAASFYFYASWNAYLACLIFASTLLDYALAHEPGWKATYKDDVAVIYRR